MEIHSPNQSPSGDPLLYDASHMPDEERVLAVTKMVLQQSTQALECLRRYGVPSFALFDWLMECSLRTQEYFTDPANRDCNKPQEQWKIIAAIHARGGSKGVPRKALRIVSGKTLLERAILQCQSLKHIKRIIVNTDCPEIAAHARECGAEAPFLRPAELSGDNSNLDEAACFLIFWLVLIENYHYDYMVLASSITPGFEPVTLQKALDCLAAANAPSLQTVATLPSCSLDFRCLSARGVVTPFEIPSLPDINNLVTQCGAFSIRSRRPYYHIHESFQPHVTEITKPPDTPIAYILPAQQCIEVDDPWDLRACEMLLGSANPVRKTKRLPEKAKLPHNGLNGILALVYVPGPTQWLDVAGSLPVAQVVQALGEAKVGRVTLWGLGSKPKPLAVALDLPYLAMDSETWIVDDKNYCGMAKPEIGDVLRNSLPKESCFSLLLVDGRANFLKAGAIRNLLHTATATHGKVTRSLSPSVIHPHYLQQITEDGSVQPIYSKNVNSRHSLPDSFCLDGVLCYMPATVDNTGNTEELGIVLPAAQGRILRNVFDGVRALALHEKENP